MVAPLMSISSKRIRTEAVRPRVYSLPVQRNITLLWATLAIHFSGGTSGCGVVSHVGTIKTGTTLSIFSWKTKLFARLSVVSIVLVDLLFFRLPAALGWEEFRVVSRLFDRFSVDSSALHYYFSDHRLVFAKFHFRVSNACFLSNCIVLGHHLCFTSTTRG